MPDESLSAEFQQEIAQLESTPDVSDVPSTEISGDESNTTPDEPNVDGSETPQYNEVELEAIKNGWDPAYKGDNFNNASTYMQIRKISDKYKAAEHRARRLEEELKADRKYTHEQLESIRERNYNALEKERIKAIELGDTQTVIQLEVERDKFSKRADTHTKNNESTQQNWPDEVIQFAERNAHWFGDDKTDSKSRAAQTFAIARQAEIKEQNPHWNLSTVINETEKDVAKSFPEFFSNQKKFMAPKVATNVSNKQPVQAKKVADILAAEGVTLAQAKEAYAETVKYSPGLTFDKFINALTIRRA